MVESFIGRAIEAKSVRAVQLAQGQASGKPAGATEHHIGAAATTLGFLSRDQEVVHAISIEVTNAAAVDAQQITLRDSVDTEPRRHR